MPVVQIHFLEGRSYEQKRKLVSKVTETICESLDVQPQQVRIILDEIPKTHYSIGGFLISENDPRPKP
ncbi:MAG: 2-hydroxymuconate tautomerase family protein [Thermovirga sp.]|nr:2-hydroxymuconate tautomerase family protein [Thermovirga sp.]